MARSRSIRTRLSLRSCAALATTTDLSNLIPGRRYEISLRSDNDEDMVAVATVELLLRRQPRVSEIFVMVAIGASKESIPAGTLVTVLRAL